MNTLALETPMAHKDVFDLPCGYLDTEGKLHTSVEVVGMNGEDEETLAMKNTPILKKMNKILAHCTVSIGEFKDRQKIEKIISELTQGDRMFLLIAIRRVTLGDDFAFISECPKCEHKSNQTVKLSDLEIIKMPNPMLRTYEVKLGDSGKKLNMHVMTGIGEEIVSKAQKDILSHAMLARIDAMDGMPATLQSLKLLPLADRNQIRDEWQDREGGVDTGIEIQCPACDYEYEGEADIGSVGFFNPLAQSRASKRSASH